jgi:hypothetical protein
LAIENRPPACSTPAHRGRIRLHGTKHWQSRPFRRQRFLCVPSNGAKTHTFSAARRAATDGHPHGAHCQTCDIRPGVAQGPITPVEFETSANEMARLVLLVGSGSSGREAAQMVRLDGQRFETDEYGARYASREFALAGRYIDLFGEAIDRELAPKSWPKILVLDSKPLNLYPYDADAFHEIWDPSKRGGAVLAAVGGNDPKRPLRAMRLGLSGDETTEAWLAFLRELPGDVEWVVADGAKAIKQAVMLRWPKARFIACEYHLGRALEGWGARDGWPAKVGKVDNPIAEALWSNDNWDAVRAFAESDGATNILHWMDANEARVRAQIALRLAPFEDHPRSNTAAEGLLNFVDRKLYRRRRFRFRNAGRLQTILNLMRAQQAGQAGQAEYGAIVKRHLQEHGWNFDPDWKAKEDDSTKVRSLSRLLIDSHARDQRRNADYMAGAKMRSVLLRIDEDNREREEMGYPPLTYTIKPGNSTVSVDVAGTMLDDYPEITRDWDRANNDRSTADITGGNAYEARWKCHRCGHEWKAEVAQRTKRRTRCQPCSTYRTTVPESVAGVRPDLIPEWDDKANLPRTAYTIKATYSKTVAWNCADPRHGTYRASPKTRIKVPRDKPACPDCKKMDAHKVVKRPGSTGFDDELFAADLDQ